MLKKRGKTQQGSKLIIKVVILFFRHFRATIKEIRKALWAHMVDDDMRRILRNSCILIAVSKGLAVASPWFLKGVVDTMSGGGTLTLAPLMLGIGAFGLTRLMSTATQEFRMVMVADFIQRGIRTISFKSF